jgi:peptidyl-prolyl cis-trans isomerase D
MIRFLQTKGRVQRVLLVGFLSLICVTMVAYLVPGINDTLNGGNSNLVAKIGNHTVTTSDITRQVSSVMRQNKYPEQYRPLVAQRVAEQMIMQQALLWQAEKLGLSTSDEEVASFLKHGPLSAYLYPDGKFIGQKEYESFVSSQFNLSVPLFEREVKNQLTTEKLQATITGGVAVGDSELRTAFVRQNTKVKFDYAVLSLDAVTKEINPSDAELHAYYEKHLKELTSGAAEQRKVVYAIAESGQLPNSAKATDADVDAFYRQHQDEFRVPESVEARHILIKSADTDPKAAQDAALARAQSVLKQLKSGGDFATLAKKFSDDPGSKERGGELGRFGRAQMVPEFSNAAFAAKPGEIVGPVKTKFGFHLIQVEKKTAAGLRPIEEIRPQLTAYVSRQKSESALQSFAQGLEKEAREHGLQQAAKAHGLTVYNSAYITNRDQLPGIGNSQEFNNYVFGSKPGASPAAVVVPVGVALVQLLEVKAPQPPSFEEVKAQLTEHFRSEAASDLLAKKTRGMYEKAKAGNDLRAAAKQFGAKVETSELVVVTGQVPDLGALSQVPNLSSLKKGEIAGPISAGNNGVVLMLLDRQEPGNAEFAAGKGDLKQQLLAQKREEQFGIYATELKQRLTKNGTLKTYPKHLEALTATTNNE